ncbi:MAG: cyclodeaminase/cyclohydrolase family protein [Planctomycetes bacterium]|nr:cyclodeaminase/cyclohydrolase family protein [Planctomycetota bacterium]
MEDFASLSVHEFLDATAKRIPVPGGGAVAALSGALSSAMARMVAAYSIGKNTSEQVRPKIEEVSKRLNRADHLFRALMTQDAEAYAAMTAAAKARREESESGSKDYQDAVLAAIGVPMEMAALAADTLETLDSFKTMASRHLISDLGVASVLAEATAQAAAYSVRINLRELAASDLRLKIEADLDKTLDRCTAGRDSLERFVKGVLE